ncbi:proline-rich basic protein 1 [Erinaceus europaeus]|uniref:Proline-rich basic protein 1 n=1 Tax=Erinaceus europaeus TaxID=9365 RepID=A0A1S2ZDC9_ERIEU|nr:proline-rich basic protein 1 [Erinaceus europaeus]
MLIPRRPPGLPGRPPAAAAGRQDSSDSSGSYHTAPGSPETPDAGGRANWPRVAPAPGAGVQPRLSVSAQNSRQQLRPGSDFPRSPGSDPRLPPPQLRTLPSGEMEVIFNAGALFSRSDAADSEVQQLTERPFCSLSTPGSGSASPNPDGGSRWATYLELRPRSPSPATPVQFECVEVALEERAQPAKSRTVPKRQIELRPRPRSPAREAMAPNPRLLLRTGSLDESLGRLQAAASLVQTALARKLSPAAPAPSKAAFGPTGRPEPATREATRSAQGLQEQASSRPPRLHYNSGPARAPRPWPSLRERAIRRDKPPPGTEPLGPVSSSIFLQAEEKSHTPEPKAGPPRENLDRTVLRPQSPSFQLTAPWKVPNQAVRPRSPSPPTQAPKISPWDRATWKARSPTFPEVPSAWKTQDPALEETVSRRRSPSPPTFPRRRNQGVAKARSPSPEPPSRREAPLLAVRDAAQGSKSPSPLALASWKAPDHPVEMWSPSPQDMWDPTGPTREAMNSSALEELAPPMPVPPAPCAAELTEAPSPATRGLPGLAFRGSQQLAGAAAPGLSLCRTLDEAECPEASGPGEAASGPSRLAIPRPRDVRKMLKTSYAPSFPGPGLPAPPAADPRGEESGPSGTPELQALGSPAPAHYTSVFLKDFLPVVSHPYEPPEPSSSSSDTGPRDASHPNGLPRRRAENSTAKPFARTEIRLPGALARGRPPEGPRGGRVRAPGGDRDAETPRLVPDGEGRTSPLGGARTSPQREPRAPEGSRPPLPSPPEAPPNSSPGTAPRPKAAPTAPEPAAVASQSPPAQPLPRAASAPPTDRAPEGPSQGTRRPPGAAPPGKVLVDPESGRYYLVEAPRQPRLRLLFDPESGQYVEVLLPPSPQGPTRRVYTPLALGPGLYPPAYGPLPGLSLPPSPGPPAFSGQQLPWAREAGALDGLYYLPVSGNPSPAPPLLLCAPSPSSGPAQPSKGALFRV